MIALLRQVADPGNSEGAQSAGMRIHRIASESSTDPALPPSLTRNGFFSLLRDEGRRSAQTFLESQCIGYWIRSIFDLDVLLEQI